MTSTSPSPKPVLRRGLVLLVFALLALAALIPNLTSSLPDRDSGVFLYLGGRILQGETPYLDVWDHKGPLIYFINALGVALHPGGEAGIWFLEAVVFFVTGMALYRGLSTAFGKGPAIASTALFFGGLVLVLRPGNFTEEFALVFVACALLVLARTSSSAEGAPSSSKIAGEDRGVGRWGALAIGLTVGATLLLRPNLAGTPIVVAAYLAGREFARRGLRGGLAAIRWIGLGATAIVVPMLVFFGARGGLAAAWDAYIRFNLLYLRGGGSSLAGTLVEGLTTLIPAGLPMLAVLGWLLSLIGLLLPRRSWRSPALVVGLVALPVELLLVGVAGRGLTHYYIAWLPILAWLSAAFFDRLSGGKVGFVGGRSVTAAIGLLTAIGLAYPTWVVLRSTLQVVEQGPRDATRWTVELSPYPEEILLMWGAEASYNYFSARPSPSRFVYQYPLYTCGYATPEMVESLAADIKEDRPLIVDTSPTNRRVPPLDPSARAGIPELEEECALSPEMASLMDGIWATYREVGRLPSTGWIVYRHQGSGPG